MLLDCLGAILIESYTIPISNMALRIAVDCASFDGGLTRFVVADGIGYTDPVAVAANIRRSIAGDFAAIHGKVGTIIHADTAAAPGTVRLVFGDLAAVHGDDSVIFSVDAAALAVMVGRIRGDFAAVHSEGAVAALYVHAAAAGCGCVVFDCAVLHDDGAVIHKYTGTAGITVIAGFLGGFIGGNLPAVHGEDAAVGHIDTAACVRGGVVSDGATLHGQGTAVDLDAGAFIAAAASDGADLFGGGFAVVGGGGGLFVPNGQVTAGYGNDGTVFATDDGIAVQVQVDVLVFGDGDGF